MEALNDTYYAAMSVYIPKSQINNYKTFVKETLVPLYEQYIGKDIVTYDVYMHKMTTEKHGEFQAWNILHLFQLEQKDGADHTLEQLTATHTFATAQMIRKEILFSTPNSNYPSPSPNVHHRRLKPMQIVEYVDVQEPYLDEFRSIMEHNNGPAMSYIMQNHKWCHHFIALETTQVVYHHPQFPTWNQLHIIALYPEAPFRYQKDFDKGLMLASNITFKQNFDRLKQIRNMLYKSVSSKLTRH